MLDPISELRHYYPYLNDIIDRYGLETTEEERTALCKDLATNIPPDESHKFLAAKVFALQDPAVKTKVFKLRVLARTILLSVLNPGWLDKLNAEALDKDPHQYGYSILDQLFGDHKQGLETLGIPNHGSHFGFFLDTEGVTSKIWKQAFLMELDIISITQFAAAA